jgi:prepilin-type N-terminal cleavage/methylation domain-containing protein
MIENPYGLQRTAFTLVEVLVALAVLSLLVILLSTMMSGVMSTWQQAEARDERRSVARRSLNLMAEDVSLMALPSNRADMNNLQFVIDPPSSTLSSYLRPHAFFGQAAVATDMSASTSQGNLAIVGYFVRWVGTDACLCRLLINPSASDYAIHSSPNNWLTSTLLDKYAPASPSGSYAGLVGENVLGLWAQALDENGNPIFTTATGSTSSYASGAYDSRLGYSVTTNGITTAHIPSALPVAVRLGVVVTDSRTARQLTGPVYPATATTNFFGDIQQFTGALPQQVQKGTEVYTEIVPLSRMPR